MADQPARRLSVAGGAIQVDMPSYYSWHSPRPRAAPTCRLDRALRPLYDGLTLALRLLRESGRKSDTVAEQGAYQQMLGGKQFQMLRVWVDRRTACSRDQRQ